MKFSKPLVLLLGSVLSASSLGCSAITAVVSDSRPAKRESRGEADRIVAIARVFENQGRYDKAEVMYRRAQRINPQDPSIKNQLQQLADRKKEKQFSPSGTTMAIATADVVSPPKPAATSLASRPVASTSGTASLDVQPSELIKTQSPGDQELPAVNTKPGPDQSAVSIAAFTPDVDPAFQLISGSKQERSKEVVVAETAASITANQVMVALENPNAHIELLMNALRNSADNEAQTLAATLLGDCDPTNTKVRDALSQQHQQQCSPELRLALCDSQVVRGEASLETAKCLTGLCSQADTETQIQSAALLRNFAGTEYESICTKALFELLSSKTPAVQATAAATFGDFNNLDSKYLQRLQELAGPVSNANVREAAESALARQPSSVPELIPSAKN